MVLGKKKKMWNIYRHKDDRQSEKFTKAYRLGELKILSFASSSLTFQIVTPSPDPIDYNDFNQIYDIRYDYIVIPMQHDLPKCSIKGLHPFP